VETTSSVNGDDELLLTMEAGVEYEEKGFLSGNSKRATK
jgi:hypothetical protein